jgi:hypothetical protein
MLREAMDEGAKVFLWVMLAIVLIMGMPLVLIWSLNTLFKTGIEYTFWTWLAALVLGLLVSGSAAK